MNSNGNKFVVNNEPVDNKINIPKKEAPKEKPMTKEQLKKVLIIVGIVSVILIIIALASDSNKRKQQEPSIEDLLNNHSSVNPQTPEVSQSPKPEVSTKKEEETPEEDPYGYVKVNNSNKGYTRYKIGVYKDNDEVHYGVYQDGYDTGNASIIKAYYCQTENCLVTSLDNVRYILVFEDKLYLYDYRDSKRKEINVPSGSIETPGPNTKSLFFYNDASKSNPAFLVIKNPYNTVNDKNTVYSLANNKIFFTTNNNIDEDNYVVSNSTIIDGCSLRSGTDANIVHTFSPSTCSVYTQTSNGIVYYFNTVTKNKRLDIYNDEYVSIKTIKPSTNYYLNPYGNLMFIENNKVVTYKKDGTKLSESKEYTNIFTLDKFYLAFDSKKLKIVSYLNVEVKDVIDWNNKVMKLDTKASGYYSSNDVDYVRVKFTDNENQFDYLFNSDTGELTTK